jgi:hypothetical protein
VPWRDSQKPRTGDGPGKINRRPAAFVKNQTQKPAMREIEAGTRGGPRRAFGRVLSEKSAHTSRDPQPGRHEAAAASCPRK